MDTTEKLNSEEKETFLLVVGELAQEQVNNTKTVNDLVTAVNVLTGKIDESGQAEAGNRFRRYPARPGNNE